MDMTTFKKILFAVTLFCAPLFAWAQPLDTATVYYENFDGSSPQVTTTRVFQTTGDWTLDSSLYSSSPACFHSSVYNRSGNSSMTTEVIPLSSSSMSQPVRHVYLSFDHICKVSQLDNATIYYSVATGIDEEGAYIWEPYRILNFSKTSSFYYGDGLADPYGSRPNDHFGNYTGGKFNDAAYGTGNSGWRPNTASATPTNSWWKHELIDITSFVCVTGATHFRLQFRINKTSPESSGSEVCAGWYVDNLTLLMSNCELEAPRITLTAPIYVNKNTAMKNNTGPYVIHATLQDNDTIDFSSIVFTYQKNHEPVVTVPNTDFTNTTPTASGHTIAAQWQLPSICYYDTIRYHIVMQDVHGTQKRLDTLLISWHDQTNIHNNDCRADSINVSEFPHCFITGTAQPVKFYFTNKSDVPHSQSTGSDNQVSLSVTLKVENENHQVTHNSTHNWTGNICFDISDTLALGSFVPTKGYNYITAYVTTRNGQADGYPANDTIKYTGFACDSLLHGNYTVGGANPDFADMAAVKAALEFCGLNGPATFHFRPGTYQDFDFSGTFPGQSATNTVTFQGDSRDNVIIVNNHNDNGNTIYGAVTLVDAHHFIFKDLTIQGKNQNVSRGVTLRGIGSSNIAFQNCKITAYQTNTTDNTSFAVGRPAAPTTSAPDTLTFTSCQLEGGNYGFYFIGANAKRNDITIQNSSITSCYRGIHTYYCNATLKGNHISQTSTSLPQNFTGINVEYAVAPDIDGNTIDSTYDAEYGICLKNASGNFFVRNNHVTVGKSNYGLYVGNSSSTSTTTGYIYNNEVILYPVTAASSYAVQIVSSNGLKVINNSLYAKSDAPFNNTAALMIQNNNTTELNNNILINQCNNSDGTDFPLYLNGTSTVTGNYNDFVSGSGVIAYKTVARNTISELEQAIPALSQSISLLPPIANTTASLLPTEFTGLECGRNANVLQDIRGLQRTGLTYMGAYANPIATVDAAVVAMVTPSLGTCPQPTYNITVSIANKGSEILNFAQNNAVVTVHSDSLSLHQTTNVTSGNIQLLGSASQIVASNVAIPTNQTIDFTFIITTNGDNNKANDTLRTSFIMEVAKPYYEEDFSNGTQQTWTIQQVSTTGAGNWTFQEGTGTNPDIAPVYGTGRLFFNSKTFANGTKSRAIMPVVDLSNAVNPILEMWFAHDKTSNKNQEGVTVMISTDGGTTFTAIAPQGQTATLVKRYKASATVPEWALYTYDLSNYISSGCVYIAFDAFSQQGNNINIDRVRLRNLLSDDIAVNQIYAQGETPAQFGMKKVVGALVRNEGRQPQTNVNVYLTVSGATEQYRDTVTIPSLSSGAETIIYFADHQYAATEVKDVEVRSRDDQDNTNNTIHWRMETTPNIANYADTAAAGLMIGDYTNVIRPCVRYQISEELAVTAVKYYYDRNYIDNPENGFRAFVSNAAGEIITTSETIEFDSLTPGTWNIIPIRNYALTNLTGEFYVGIEMLSKGDYLCAQVETPLRDSTFFYLESNGTYTPQTTGRFMIGALVDTPYVHDLALLDMQNPTTRCDLGHEHILVSLTNNGMNDVLPGTRLNYSVNGLPTVTETLTDTLFSHVTRTYTFNTDFDFTNNLIDYDSIYNIKVWFSKDAQDRLQYNDTLSMTILSLGKSPRPLVQDTVNVPYHTVGILTAHLPASVPQGVIGWYANTGYESWEFLGYTDSTFATPVINFDTVFYANTNPGTLYDNIVGTGTQYSGSQPFIFNSGYSRGRMIYTETEVGQHGSITTIGLNVKNFTSSNIGEEGIPVKIYMKQRSAAQGLYPTTAIDWDNDILGATLVYDGRLNPTTTGWYYIALSTPFNYAEGNLEVLVETNCGDYCTGTGSQCNNCGQYVSGGTGYPNFYQTATPNNANGYVQYKNANTRNMTGNYTNFTKRLNMYFKIANLECGSEKVPIYIHVPDIPNYDVETQTLDSPTGGCTIRTDEHIQVTVKNMLNNPIPAGKVTIHAQFNNRTVTHTINEPFASEEVKTVTFTDPVDLSAPTANVTYNYTIYTTLNGESVVYTRNDTITGSFVSSYTVPVQDQYVYTGYYDSTMVILQPNDVNGFNNKIRLFKYFRNQGDATPLQTPTVTLKTYTTPALYDTVTYWFEGTTRMGSGNGTDGCPTRRVPIHINVFKPQYDLETMELVEPVSYQCQTTMSPKLKVKVMNTDTAANSVIPANTFVLKADFYDGTSHVTGNSNVNVPVSHRASVDVQYANGMNLVSRTQNKNYQYTVYTDPIESSMAVVRYNDTVTGTIKIPASPAAPSNITRTGVYGQPLTVTLPTTPLNFYYFYETATSTTPIAQGTTFTTDPIYSSPKVYYYSGRIENADFEENILVGNVGTAPAYNGGTDSELPFSMSSNHSYAKILYAKSEMGGLSGRIDSIGFNVSLRNASGSSVPVKIWLKNTPDAATIASTSVNWATETNSAQLVFDGELGFESTGWFSIPLTGGFDYEGEGLFMYVEHDCGDGTGTGCTANEGISPLPKFKNTNITSNNLKKVLKKSNNTAITGTTTFQKEGNRWNTKFFVNHTCESPRGTITITTSVPQKDVAVLAITAPTTPDNAYTQNEQVTVTLKNNGSQSVSNVPVNYQLANGTPVTQNCTQSIASGATVNFSFTTRTDLTSVYFDTPFKVYTSLTGDSFHNNDTASIMLKKQDPGLSHPQTSIDGVCIANVKFAGIDNGTAAPFVSHPQPDVQLPSDRYVDYTSTTPANVVVDQRYPIEITHAFNKPTASGSVYKKVYIDYDRNGVFDNSELVYNSGSIPGATNAANATTMTYIDIPATAQTGLTRMRIICSANNVAYPDRIYNFAGETEDYAVQILPSYTHDMGIVDYVHPVGYVCPDTAAIMRVTLKNFGTQSETFSPDNSLTVTATVAQGGNTATYNTTLTSGTVAPGETITAVIDHVNMDARGDYNISSRLTYQPDQYSHNDTLSAKANTDSLSRVLSVPFTDNFETNTGTSSTGLHFTSDWYLGQSNPNYVWIVNQGASANNPTAGAAHDHTQEGLPLESKGRFATVPGISGSSNQNKWTTLTTRCINMHYRNGYPVELNLWKHFYGENDADFKLYIEAGSGKTFVVIDSLTRTDGGQTSATSPWSSYTKAFSQIDEIAQLRFRLTGQKKRIDPCLDDISLSGGLPDLELVSIDRPSNDDSSCVIIGSDLCPVVTFRNNGFSPIREFDVRCTMAVGSDFDTIIQHVETNLAPDETIRVEFDSCFHVSFNTRRLEFRFMGLIDSDKDTTNNLGRIITCTNYDVPVYEKMGIIVAQNEPNPAANSTRIAYTVPNEGKAMLSIYSAAGQLLYTDAQDVAEGEHYFDVNTSKLADGIYFYTFSFNDVIVTKKMVVQR